MTVPKPDRPTGTHNHRLLRWLGGGAGLVLLAIGFRFLIVPEAATRTFGLGAKPDAVALDAVIGLRDVWLAGLALAFAVWREWRALALWLVLGAGVCIGDALIVAADGGPSTALAFHGVSGVFCGAVGWRCWLIARKSRGNRGSDQ